MGIKLNFKDKAASSFMEYVIILGVASAFLIGMNTYLKRGIQARLKDMTDYFIVRDLAPEKKQLVEINPTESESNTISEATLNNDLFLGGGTREERFETRNIQASSNVEDIEPLFQSPDTVSPPPAITIPSVPEPTPPPSEGGT